MENRDIIGFTMDGCIHKKCGTELQWHQIQGIRLLRENNKGKMVYDARCPKCKEDFEIEKGHGCSS